MYVAHPLVFLAPLEDIKKLFLVKSTMNRRKNSIILLNYFTSMKEMTMQRSIMNTNRLVELKVLLVPVKAMEELIQEKGPMNVNCVVNPSCILLYF